MGSQPLTAHVSRLADALWYERRLLEFLLFKLVSANLVLTVDDKRFVGPAIAEVEKVMEEVRAVELERSTLVTEVAEEWGVGSDSVSLAYLAQHAPDEVSLDFEDHQETFMQLVAEIEQLTQDNRKLATVGLDGIRETLRLVGGVDPGERTYDAIGRPQVSSVRPTKIDEVL